MRIRRTTDGTIVGIAALLLGWAALTAAAADIYVSPSGNDGNDGDSWNDAYATIAKAFTEANHNDVIHLAGGHTFVLSSTLTWPAVTNLTLRGGYEGVVGAPGENDPERWPTTLRRGGARVLSMSGRTRALIEGITFTGATLGNTEGGGDLHQ